MANNPVVNTLTFTGSVAGQATIQSQGIAGGLTFLLPNTVPVQGQLITATSINGNNVFLGWSSQESLSNIPLSALAQSGATNGQVIEWNGSAWTPTSTPGTSPGGSAGQIQYNNAGAFGGASNSSISGSGAVVLGNVADPSPVATTAFTVSASGGIAIHAQDWYSSNEGFVVASMQTSGLLNVQGLNIQSSISIGAQPPLVVKGSTISQDIAQFFTGGSSVPANTKTVFVDFNGNLNLVGGLKDSTASLGTNGQVLTSNGSVTVWGSPTVNFNQLTGSLAISQINSKQGNGSKVQLSTGTTTTGDVVTYDANGNAIDSGTLLTSLAPIDSPTFTGLVTLPVAASTTGLTMLSDNNQVNSTNAPIVLSSATATNPQVITITPNSFFGPQIQFTGQNTPYTTPRLTEVGAQGLYMSNSGFFVNSGGLGTSGQVLSTLGVAGDGGPAGLAWTTLSFAPLNSPTFTGTVVLPSAVNATGGSDLIFTNTGANKIRIATATGVFDFFGTGGGMTLGSQNSQISIDATGNIALSATGGSILSVAASGGLVTSSDFKPTNLFDFPGNGSGSAGQLFSSLGTDSGTAWISQSSLSIAGSQITGNTLATSTLATVQGNGGKVQLSTGTTTTNDIVKYDANGNTVDSGVQISNVPLKVTTTITSAQLLALSSYTLSAAANAVGPNTDYTGTFTGVTIPAGMLVTIAGFTTPANNGVFTVVSNNATTLTVTNAAGTSETHAATADTSVQILPPPGSGLLYNPFQGYANYVFGTTPYTDSQTQKYGIAVLSPAELPATSGFVFALAGAYVSDLFNGTASSQVSQLANNFGNNAASQLNNQPLVFAFLFSVGGPADQLSGGDGTLNVTVYYTVEAVA